jgi:hypothetical protein
MLEFGGVDMGVSITIFGSGGIISISTLLRNSAFHPFELRHFKVV